MLLLSEEGGRIFCIQLLEPRVDMEMVQEVVVVVVVVMGASDLSKGTEIQIRIPTT